MLLLGSLLPLAGDLVAAQTGGADVPVVTIDRPITPAVANRVTGAIGRAGDGGAPALILRIEASNGTLAATDDIRQAIGRSDVPVVTWVPPGVTVNGPGALLVLAGQVRAMAPDSRIAIDDGYARTANPFDDDMPAVTRTEEVTALASQRGTQTGWVAEAVRTGAAFPGDQAVGTGIVDVLADTPAAVLAVSEGRPVELAGTTATFPATGASPAVSEPTFLEALWLFVTMPTVAYLLLCFGAIGLLLEISSPGITFPGVAGVLALGSAAVLLGGMPLNWTGLILIAGGLALLIVDVFVPSLGLLTLGGLSAFVVGSYVLFEGGGAGYSINPVAIWVVTVCLVLFFLLLASSALRALRRRPLSGQESMVGQIGEARTPLAPEGMVFIGGETWRAHAMTLYRTAAAPIIPAGTPVIVTKVDGLLLEVRIATAEEVGRSAPGPTAPDRRTVVPVRHESAVD